MAKRIEKNIQGIDRSKFYSLDEAVKLVKERANAKFNETIEVAMNLRRYTCVRDDSKIK